jgi:prepilin-type N-terminal cleavage/methylation domain-containing protein
MRSARSHAGFTLLEVLVALALLSVSLMVIVRLQGQAVVFKSHEEHNLIAVGLARSKMVDLELQLEEDGYGSQDKEECGDFKSDLGKAFDAYSWCWEVKKAPLTIPENVFGGGGEEGGQEGGQDVVTSMASSFGLNPESISEELGKGIRQLSVTVKWKSAGVDDSLTLQTHVVRTEEMGGGIPGLGP